MESIPTLYNSQAPQSWEEMRLDRNEKLIPAPLTDGLGRSPYGDRPRLDKTIEGNAHGLVPDDGWDDFDIIYSTTSYG